MQSAAGQVSTESRCLSVAAAGGGCTETAPPLSLALFSYPCRSWKNVGHATVVERLSFLKRRPSAVACLQVLVRAAPDELGLLAPELVRSLLHCRVPEWAEEEARGGGPDASPGLQRLRCLVALLATAPLQGGGGDGAGRAEVEAGRGTGVIGAKGTC